MAMPYNHAHDVTLDMSRIDALGNVAQVVHMCEAVTQVLQKVQNWALQWPREHASRNWLAIGSFLSMCSNKLMILYMHVRSLCQWLGDLPHHLCALVVLAHVFGSDLWAQSPGLASSCSFL